MQLFLLLTTACMTLLSVLAAAACWKRVSECAALQSKTLQQGTAIAELESSLARTHDLVRKLSARASLEANREKRHPGGDEEFRRDAPPPPGATKAQLREHYLKGKNHIEIARLAAKG